MFVHARRFPAVPGCHRQGDHGSHGHLAVSSHLCPAPEHEPKGNVPPGADERGQVADLASLAPRRELRMRKPKSAWALRYGKCHRYEPILDDPLLPNGYRGKVRIYRRGNHDGPGPHRFILNWYDGANRKRAVVGDKFAAVTEADRINSRLASGTRPQTGAKRLTVEQLVGRYLEYQRQRANASEISPRTAARYRTALEHLVNFAEQTRGAAQVRAVSIDERFVLSLKRHLLALEIHPNGHPHVAPRPVSESGVRFVLSTARAAWEWARETNPALLPETARNPFRGHVGATPPKAVVEDAAVDTSALIRMIDACDAHQLIVFAPVAFYGMRPAEACHLMVEDWMREDGLLTVACAPELNYKTNRADRQDLSGAAVPGPALGSGRRSSPWWPPPTEAQVLRKQRGTGCGANHETRHHHGVPPARRRQRVRRREACHASPRLVRRRSCHLRRTCS